MALYNEIDAHASEWLKNLVAAGHIAPGVVDARSIKSLRATDVSGHVQCHFFAGIGVWSHALRLAGWPDDRPVWTGSCPCQPFSVAGRGLGFADPRHLWPDWFRLIRECRPPVVLGEQVAGKDGAAWLDLVQADLEGTGYAFGAAVLPAAGVGAPHQRHRIYWAAYADAAGLLEQRSAGLPAVRDASRGHDADGRGEARGVANADQVGRFGRQDDGGDECDGPDAGRAQVQREFGACRQDGRLGHSDCEHAGRDAGAGRGAEAGCGLWRGGDVPGASGAARRVGESAGEGLAGRARERGDVREEQSAAERAGGEPGPVNGFWADAEWIPCRDGYSRPAKPGAFPLAHGVTGRVGRLRAYGNAIVAQVAATFIEAVMDALDALDALEDA